MKDTTSTLQGRNASNNSLCALSGQGQSLWLDHITRDLVRGGELRRLIVEDGLRGETSNPTIFHEAIAAGTAYDDQLAELARSGHDAAAIFEALAVTDIQEACDLFRPLYDSTDGADGFVSIEVSPQLAHDSQGMIAEARRLWQRVARPNLMVKLPGTAAGAPAVEQLLREGININITLLFALRNHERVMWRYISALEQRATAGQPLDHIASVASFFVSRVDTLVDKQVEARIGQTRDAEQQTQLRRLLGNVAIANAKLAYERFRAIFGGERFQRLRARGARVQRVLWASTSTKNPAYRDVRYVEELIGPDTVVTAPLKTIQAFKDHGQVRRTVDTDVEGARATLALLKSFGVDYDAVTQQLEDEGIAAFVKSYDELLAGVEQKRARFARGAERVVGLEH
jgi:transaldolase